MQQHAVQFLLSARRWQQNLIFKPLICISVMFYCKQLIWIYVSTYKNIHIHSTITECSLFPFFRRKIKQYMHQIAENNLLVCHHQGTLYLLMYSLPDFVKESKNTPHISKFSCNRWFRDFFVISVLNCRYLCFQNQFIKKLKTVWSLLFENINTG